MKRGWVIVFLLFLGILAFFTFFGDTVYDWMTPEVSAYTVRGSFTYMDASYQSIPMETLTDGGTVFEIVSEQGFSRELFALREIEIEYIEDLFDWEEDVLYLTKALRSGTRLLLDPDGSHKNGTRVRVKRGR